VAGGDDHPGVGRGLPRYGRLRPRAHDWPEQEVNTVEEEKDGGAQISFELVDGGARS